MFIEIKSLPRELRILEVIRAVKVLTGKDVVSLWDGTGSIVLQIHGGNDDDDKKLKKLKAMKIIAERKKRWWE